MTRAVNGTHDSASFTAIKQELESLKEELVASFNAKDVNGYIFGGVEMILSHILLIQMVE